MLDKITATIVTYKNPDSVLLKAINSFLDTKIEVRLYIIDNSPTNYLKDISHDPRVEYIFMNSNNGFGAGHNVILRDPEKMGKYHLILNPDISFEEGTLEKLYDYMEGKPDVGNVMPRLFILMGNCNIYVSFFLRQKIG